MKTAEPSSIGTFRTRVLPGLVVLVGWLAAATTPAATPDPALQKKARAATFEVVLPKAKEEGVTYDRPPPLELIPFAERNDPYVSIGSAFAIGPNRFVTAHHVLVSGYGSLTGPIVLRDSAGKVYRIDQVLQASNTEDYAVFTLVDPPSSLQPLETGEPGGLDEVVYAAGNALGEGVVVRDGLLTSTTPEARSGRWNWLRFSAAASPGNSGGPLLDAGGRAIGVVVAKSPSENLNYALPIDRVLQGNTREAVFEVQTMFGMSVMQDSTVIDQTYRTPLPASYEDLARKTIALTSDQYRKAYAQLVGEHGATMFPRGDVAEYLASTTRSLKPTLMVQAQDRRWFGDGLQPVGATPLPGDGRVEAWGNAAVTLFRVTYPEAQLSAATYRDLKEPLEQLLKVLSAQRNVGGQSVRITSLGEAKADGTHTDAYGRRWQVRRWDAAVIQTSLIVYALPTPDGYVGMAMQSGPALLDTVSLEMAATTDFFTTSYTGTIAQWRAFLGQPSLRPDALAGVKLVPGKDAFEYASPELQLRVPADLMPVDEASVASVYMAFVRRGDAIVWRPVGLQVEKARADQDFVRVFRVAKPAPQVSRELQSAWTQMTTRTGDYSGEPRRDASNGQSWFVTTREVPGGDAVYVVRYLTTQSVSPAEMDRRRDELLGEVRVPAPGP